MTRSWTALLGISVILFACADGTATTDSPVDPSAGAGGADAGTDAPAIPAADAQPAADAAGGFDAAPPKPDAGAVSLACGKTFDFESTDGSFTHLAMDGANGASFDAWSYGDGANTLNCHSGTKCFATNLTGPYAQCQRAELRSPAVDLSTCAGASSIQVTFWQSYDFLGYTDATGATYYDGGIIEMSGDGGATWTTAISTPPSIGNVSIAAARGLIGQYACPGPSAFHVDAKSGFINKSSGWEAFEVDVPVELRTSQFMVRFAYASGKSTADNALAVAKPGWHIDDVAVVVK